jgi:hypothetical protein
MYVKTFLLMKLHGGRLWKWVKVESIREHIVKFNKLANLVTIKNINVYSMQNVDGKLLRERTVPSWNEVKLD